MAPPTLSSACILCAALLWTLAGSAAHADDDLDALVVRGEALAQEDPLAAELLQRQGTDASRRGFAIGMAAAEGHTLPGPGKQRLHDSLPPDEQAGFDAAVGFSLERNKYADLARTGAAIATADEAVAQTRVSDADVRFWLGFDIATGIFGDPALGAKGNTAVGPGSLKIRDSLSPAAQRGFNASMNLLLARHQVFDPSTTVMSAAKSGATFDQAYKATVMEGWSKPTFIGAVEVTPGWTLSISFTSTQKSKPLVEIGRVPPTVGGDHVLAFPSGSGALSRFVTSETGRYYADFDVTREGFAMGEIYYYIVNVFSDGANKQGRDQATGRFVMGSAGQPQFRCHDNMAQGIDGSEANCSPYLCQAGQCMRSCGSVQDCAPQFACNASQQCEYLR